MSETTIPVLPCLVDPDDVLEFYRSLGFEVTYDMRRPYLYLAIQFGDIHLHFGRGSSGLDPANEDAGGALVMVDELEPYHAVFTAGLRARHGKVLSSGRPRMTRLRPDQSRFTVVDPSGNNIIFIRRDAPDDLDYGGSHELEGLERVLDSARILREFKQDDRAAARVLDVGLRRFGDHALPVVLARALAARVELAIVLDDEGAARDAAVRLAELPLSEDERAQIADDLAAASRLADWLQG